MSSLRLSEATTARAGHLREDGAWITLRPLQDVVGETVEAGGSAGVVLMLRARRAGIALGERREETIDVEHDESDSAGVVAHEIEGDLDARWDD